MATNAEFIDNLLKNGRPTLPRSPTPVPGWRDAPFRSDGTQDLTHPGSPPSWNKLIINGTTLPWLCKLTHVKHMLVKQHGGASGQGPGSPTVRGRLPGDFGFQFVLRTNEEWDNFVELAPRLLPIVQREASQAERLSSSVQIYFPLVAAFGIRWAVVAAVEGKSPEAGGPALITATFEETQDPSKVVVKQARPRSTGSESAQIIQVAGEAPRNGNLRDTARKPLQNAR